MTHHIDEQGLVGNAPRNDSVSVGSALFLTVLVVVALASLALWPTKQWSPPPRPGITRPIVFDEFVNATSAAPAAER